MTKDRIQDFGWGAGGKRSLGGSLTLLSNVNPHMHVISASRKWTSDLEERPG